MLIIRCISGRKSGHENPRSTHLQVFWGMMSGAKIDFADPIMSDIVFQIHSKSGRTMIPFLRFTKMIIGHLCGNTPEFLQRMFDQTEAKHNYVQDCKISFVKSIQFTPRTRGLRIPDHLLNDKIRSSPNYRIYNSAYLAGKVGVSETEEVLSLEVLAALKSLNNLNLSLLQP